MSRTRIMAQPGRFGVARPRVHVLGRLRLRTSIPAGAIRALLMACASSGFAASSDVAVTTAVPQRGDHTLLSWREGPPYFTNARYSSDRRFLRLETGYFAMEFDTERIALTGFTSFSDPRDEASATRAALAAQPLLPAQLQLSIRVGDTLYLCTGRRPIQLDAHGLPAVPLQFPIRVIESGRFFQKFAVHELEFQDVTRRRLPASARLEIAAWPDRIAFTLVVTPEQLLPNVRSFLRLRSAGGMDASRDEPPEPWTAEVERRVTLTLNARGAAIAPVEPPEIGVRVGALDARGSATVRWNPEELCHTIRLGAAPWPEPIQGNYPEPMLDAWEAYAVTVENRGATPQRVALNFGYAPPKAITGFVPMLVDEHNRPLGIPVQISKNWHQVTEGDELPYAGPWMHGRTWLTLAPHSRVAFRYGTTFARWGGVPTASLAQLSLVGWGHNGFWDQFALGAFGESFCFQPGRTMRRALLTDFRPLFQRGFAQGERWAWTSNLGGSDTMVRLDRDGRYVPFKRNVTRYASHGPNLAHLVYEEISADETVSSRVEVFLPRTDDHVRVFLGLRYDVRRRVEFSHLALLQFGAEYYNESAARAIAWGDSTGLVAEHRPTPESGARLLPLWQSQGNVPWVSLHGETRRDSDRAGQGARGLVVRKWHAVMGGRPVAAPLFAAVGSRGAKPRLAAEIVPPPGLMVLEAGDCVEMLVELVALPLAVERYYGPDKAFAAALASDANTWKMVHREAAFNQPTLQLADGAAVHGWPLRVPAEKTGETGFTLTGGVGWIPVCVTGLVRPVGLELFRITRTGRERVVQGEADQAYWQCDYDTGAGRWNVTYNLPAAASPASYEVRLREAIYAEPLATPRSAMPVER